MRGWPNVEVTPETIAGWARKHSRWQDTGLRVQDRLAVIDLDIDDVEAQGAVAAALEAKWPALMGALLRYGKGAKEAWFCRTTEAFGRIHTRRWLAPGAELDKDGTHVVEIFGGGAPRQFGAFGAHTRNEAGEVVIAYEWADHSPATVPLAALPEFDKATYFAIVDEVERVLAGLGWAPVLKTERGESEATRVFDLVEGMVFETNTGEDAVPFSVLRDRRGEEGLRVSASFIEPGRQHSRTRCLVGETHSGDISVWDSATGVTHLAADRAPVAEAERQAGAAAVAERLRRLAEHQSEEKQKRQARLSPDDDYLQAAGKLLRTYALCPTQQLQVVPLFAESVSDGMTMTNFRMKMLPWVGIELGPRDGEKKINPADVWAGSDRRVEVAGLRMRPDRSRPTYDDGGKSYVNVYTPAIHPDGGDAGMGQAFLCQLLPDAVERAWFTQWLAFKYRNPAIPGPAVVLVARAYGTGRGTLAELVRRLFSPRYVKALDFNTFAGKTYQSQYNAWGAESLVVVVNESSDAQGGSIYQGKRDTYERLKDLVEPRPIERHFVRHGLPPFTAPSFTSYIIATQHPDALPLPADDRRFWVGTNGEPREAAYWEELNAWMDAPENVGAFARWLEAVDIEDYSPFAPPPLTTGKRAMIDMAGSPIDHALGEAIESLPGEVLIPDQIVHAMGTVRDAWGLDFPDRWEAIARRALQSRLYRIGEKDGPSWVLRIEGKKYPLYARTDRLARKWGAGGGDDLRREALKNGAPNSGKSVAEALAKLRLVASSGGTARGDA